jgi:hypothetical protein
MTSTDILLFGGALGIVLAATFSIWNVYRILNVVEHRFNEQKRDIERFQAYQQNYLAEVIHLRESQQAIRTAISELGLSRDIAARRLGLHNESPAEPVGPVVHQRSIEI